MEKSVTFNEPTEMFICKSCLQKENQNVAKNLILATCSICKSPEMECAAEGDDSQRFNNEVSNWHKYSEDKASNSSSSEFQIPENGLYLWLRPITPTSSKDQQKG